MPTTFHLPFSYELKHLFGNNNTFQDISLYCWEIIFNCVGCGGIITHNNQQLAHSLLFINAMLEIQRTAKILNGAVALIKPKLQISDLCNYSTVYMLSKWNSG